MKVHNLIQGTPEWVAFRFEHFGASEAAAMLGLSTKMTRTELLHLKYTGNAKEFSDYVQERILDEGHRIEALARPIMAARIGEKLYPVTCSDGKLSASCDGLTMDETKGWEHKQWNQALAEAVAAGELPDEYMAQPQQCMLVTGAEEWIFTVSDGTDKNMVSMAVKRDPVWFDRIQKGWAQFEIDLATYVPRVAEVKPVGRTPESLPALRVEVTGMVTASNLAEYKEHALAVFDGINRNLKTDQDFADADKIVKWCGDVESRLEQVKEHALSQTQSIDTLFKTIDDIKAKARETRLELDKLVTKRKGEVKDEIVLNGRRLYDDHVAALKEETGGLWVPIPQPDFAGAIKGKRSLDSMHDAVSTMLSVYKVAANDAAAKIRTNVAALKTDGEGFEFLFSDRAALVSKSPEDLKLLIKSRIDAHKAAKAAEEEATRERIRAEEQAKAEREAREKVAAEQAAVVPVAQPASVEAAPNVVLVRASDIDLASIKPRQSMVPSPSEAPTLKLGAICSRLEFAVTADLLEKLGFTATVDRNARLYHEDKFPAICKALIDHITNVSEQFDAVPEGHAA
jgi:predicted phage-related endonuclease